MIALLWLACAEPASREVLPPTVGGASVPRPAEVAPPAAPPDHLGLGRAATSEEVAAWDEDVDSRGVGLPEGSGTVAEGKALYATRCAACHGTAGEGGVAPVLVLTAPTTGFGEDPKLPRSIGNYWPYATTVYEYVHRAMPQTAPGSLTADETYALTAFLLAENGAVPADFVADRETLPRVVMPTKVTFVDDDREASPEFR